MKDRLIQTWTVLHRLRTGISKSITKEKQRFRLVGLNEILSFLFFFDSEFVPSFLSFFFFFSDGRRQTPGRQDGRNAPAVAWLGYVAKTTSSSSKVPRSWCWELPMGGRRGCQQRELSANPKLGPRAPTRADDPLLLKSSHYSIGIARRILRPFFPWAVGLLR